MFAGGKMILETHGTSEVIDRHPDAEIIRKIIHNPLISYALDSGAWIAGGFARAVFLGKRMDQFFSRSDYSLAGDIDLFFDNQEAVDNVIKFFMNSGYISKSYGGNAIQTTCHLGQTVAKYSDITSISVQVVNNPELILPIREQLDRFDFTNVCCAFRGETFLAPSNILELEANYRLDIKNSTSPFLAARVRKYMRRGFVGVTEDSRQHITDWLINAVADNFKGNAGLAGTVKDAAWCKQQIRDLLNKSAHVLRSEDLIMLIGMFKRDVANGRYGDTFVIDEALEALNMRNNVAA
jgi:hypothetical protein